MPQMPNASCKILVFAKTLALASFVLRPKFKEAKLPSLTPPSRDVNAMRTRIPVWPSNIVRKINDLGDELVRNVDGLEKEPLKGVNVVVGSTDIHVFGKEVIKRVLREAGANIFDLDQSATAQEFADTMIETESSVLCVSTHNGLAYSYAKDLQEKLRESGLENVLVIMGGLMNEALPGKELPEDVSAMIADLGFNVDNNAEKIVEVIKAHMDSRLS